MDNRVFGQRLAEARKAVGLTQAQAAERVGCSVPALQRWESGQNSPSVNMLVRLADGYDTFVNVLLGARVGLQAGYVMVDRPKVNRILATTDPQEIAKEFSVGSLATLDWNVVVPDGAELMSREDASELARVIDAHVLQHAGAELRSAVKKRLEELS